MNLDIIHMFVLLVGCNIYNIIECIPLKTSRVTGSAPLNITLDDILIFI